MWLSARGPPSFPATRTSTVLLRGTRLRSKKRDLNPEFFPTDVFEEYFNPRRKRKADAKSGPSKSAINLDEFNDEDNDEDKSDNDRASQASEEAEDYDVDEEYDNDYAENYFDNGENDDFDNLGDGGGGDEGGGGMDYD
ncbi:hypothetical protein NP233_g8068 [Leucocoprinus birnbaumii]|uniref:DNA-directed RNA polymerase III subunit n=1 Tax=Leucocoprinus birnbaumii TaxID=56174 RepID=A0AAD5YU24_9AGAR|nr:hypothetical protein NP233_g8068 [Leucocoprinus birnbaumii]